MAAARFRSGSRAGEPAALHRLGERRHVQPRRRRQRCATGAGRPAPRIRASGLMLGLSGDKATRSEREVDVLRFLARTHTNSSESRTVERSVGFWLRMAPVMVGF